MSDWIFEIDSVLYNEDTGEMCMQPKYKSKLIRCGECKHFRTYYHGENMPFSYACDRMYLTNNLSRSDFCSRGEEKEAKHER